MNTSLIGHVAAPSSLIPCIKKHKARGCQIEETVFRNGHQSMSSFFRPSTRGLTISSLLRH